MQRVGAGASPCPRPPLGSYRFTQLGPSSVGTGPFLGQWRSDLGLSSSWPFPPAESRRLRCSRAGGSSKILLQSGQFSCIYGIISVPEASVPAVTFGDIQKKLTTLTAARQQFDTVT